MTDIYNERRYKPGFNPSRLQRNYNMTYEDAYKLAQELNYWFNRLYKVEQENKNIKKILHLKKKGGINK